MVACLEEIAYHLGRITDEDVARIACPMKTNDYRLAARRDSFADPVEEGHCGETAAAVDGRFAMV